MLSAWPSVTASCATAISSASTDAESRRLVVIHSCYISPTIVGASYCPASCRRALTHSRYAASSFTERIRSCREREWRLRRRLVNAQLAQVAFRELVRAVAEGGQIVARIDVTARQRVDGTGR